MIVRVANAAQLGTVACVAFRFLELAHAELNAETDAHDVGHTVDYDKELVRPGEKAVHSHILAHPITLCPCSGPCAS